MPKFRRRGEFHSCMLVPFILSAGTAAHAADATGQPQTAVQPTDDQTSDASSDKHSAVQEIIVTARRRAENVQKVPETVQVISEQSLKAQNIQSVTDLQYVVPGLSGITNTPNQIRLTLRGQGALGNLSYPGVIFFDDEVPIPTFPGGAQNAGPGLFFDIASLQVLKGPQGTLFGKGSAGGDILITSAPPTKTFGGYADVGIGNYNDREFDAVVNIPVISDKLLTRFAYSSQTRDGYTKILGTPNHTQGIDGDNRDTKSFRATVEFDPTDWFHNVTIWNENSYKGNGAFGVLAYLDPSGAFVAQYPGAVDEFQQQQQLGIRTIVPIGVDPVSNGSHKALINKTTIDLGAGVQFKNIFGYGEENNTFAGDQDNTIYPWFDVYSYPRSQTVWQYSDEAQLLGKSLGDRLDWVIGAIDIDEPDSPDKPSHYYVENYSVFGGPVHAVNTGGSKEKAVYGHLIVNLGDMVHGLSLNGGIRFTRDSYSTHLWYANGTCLGDAYDCALAIGTPTVTAGHSHAFTWTAGVQEQISSQTMVYLTSSRGYRPGGTNGFSAVLNAQLPDFGPEYVQETDLGIKSDWRLGAIPVHTDIALWHQDYTNIQEQVLHPVSEGGVFTQNAGKAKFNGVEVELRAQLTRTLEVGAQYAYIHKKYGSFLPGVDVTAIQQLNDTKTLGDPPNKLNLYADYTLPVPEQLGRVWFRAMYNWQDTSGWRGVVDDLGMQKSFGLLNLSLNWDEINGSPVDLSLFMSNATNKVYVTQGVQAWEPLYWGYGDILYGEPRMFGARLHYHFG